jgi:hypothetical protein
MRCRIFLLRIRSPGGTIRFADLTDSDCAGDLRWNKPLTAGRVYPAAFDTTASCQAATYAAPPPSGQVLLFSNADVGVGMFSLLGGNLTQPILHSCRFPLAMECA